MKVNLSITRKGLILVCVPLVFELVFVACLVVLLKQAEYEAWRESHAKNTVAAAHALSKLFYDTGECLVNYVLTRNQQSLKKYDANVLLIAHELRSLRMLVLDNPSQQESMDRLERAGNNTIEFLNKAKFAIDQEERGILFTRARSMRNEMKRLLTNFMNELNSFIQSERSVEISGQMEAQKLRDLLDKLIATGVVLNVLITLALALFFSRSITSRLSVLTDNTRRLAREEPLHPPISGGDEISQLDRVFHDMAAALAEATRKERAIIENAVDVIFSIDAEGRFARVNPASLTVWGYEPQELTGRKYTDVIFEDDVPRTIRAVSSLMGGKGAGTFENRVTRKDGSLIDTLWSAQWAGDEQSLFCVAHDITERRELERLKQQFLAMVSHDLRTPLTSIQFSLSLVLEGALGDLPEEAREELAVAEKSSDHLIKLINDLLTMEKIEAGKFKLDMAETGMRSVATRAAEAVRAFAERYGISIVLPDDDCQVLADGDRLVQVLVNLLSNAVKFSPRGSQVKVEVEHRGECVEVRVVDQGRGIPDSHKELIFDRFQQVGMADAKKKGGTGLGLAICKAIVEAHEGTIGLESREGEGSTFWFRIPCQRQALEVAG